MARRGTFVLESDSGDRVYRDACFTSDPAAFVTLLRDHRLPIVLEGEAAALFSRVHDHRRDQKVIRPLMGGMSRVLSFGSDRQSLLAKMASGLSDRLLDDSANFDDVADGFLDACDVVLGKCEFHYFGRRSGIVISARD